MKMMELTEPSKATEKIRINTGEIAIKDWLEKDKARIETDPDRTAVIIEKKNGLLSLWVNRVIGDSWGKDIELEVLLKNESKRLNGSIGNKPQRIWR